MRDGDQRRVSWRWISALVIAVCRANAWQLDCHLVHPAVAFQQSEIVFVGRALRSAGPGSVYATSAVYKGSAGNEVSVQEPTGDLIGFRAGVEYLIFARRATQLPGAPLVTGACAGSRELRRADAQMEWLRRFANGGPRPRNALLVEPWFDGVPATGVQLRFGDSVVPLRRLGAGQYVAEDLAPGDYVVEAASDAYRAVGERRVHIVDGAYLCLRPLFTANRRP